MSRDGTSPAPGAGLPVELCPVEERAPVFRRLEPLVRGNPHEALGAKTGPGDYLDLKGDIRALAESTWRHLGSPVLTVGKRRGQVEYKWVSKAPYAGRAVQADLVAAARVLPPDMARRLAASARYSLVFNRELFRESSTETRTQFIVHEACHIAAYLAHPERDVGHGPEWQALMRRCGCKPDIRAHGVEGEDLVTICTACGMSSHLTVDEAGQLLGLAVTQVCHACGADVDGRCVRVPEHLKARVETARNKVNVYRCPECGYMCSLPSGEVSRLRAAFDAKTGAGLSCPGCRTPASAAGILVGGRRVPVRAK